MDPVKDTVDFSNQNSGEVLPRAGNVATNAQSDISAEWNNLLFGGTSMSSQPQLPLSMLSMTPALTPEDLGLHTPAVSEPIMADVGLLNFAYPAFADTPVTPQATQHQHSGAGRARNICNVCLREFARPSNLIIHMRSHTGEKPYKCNYPGCFKRFSVRSNQRRHTKLHGYPVLPCNVPSQYILMDVSTGRILGYHPYSPFN